MNIFTKLTTAALLAGGLAFSAGAQSLGTAQYVDPQPNSSQTFLRMVRLGWSVNLFQLELVTYADTDLSILVTFPDGKSYTLDYLDYGYDLYLDPEMNTNMPESEEDLPEGTWGNELIVDFGTQAFEAGEPVGIYTIEIPEGLVKNIDGRMNAAQTLTYRKVNPIAPISITPSEKLSNGEMGGVFPEINNITLTFDDTLTLNRSADPIHMGMKDEGPYDNGVYLEKYSIGSDGKSLVIDVKDLMKRGVWYYIEIPEGIVQVGENYVNGRVYLEYMYWDGMQQATLLSAPLSASSIYDVKPFILTWDYQNIYFPKEALQTEFVIGFPDYGWQDGERIWIPADWYEQIHVDEDGTISHVSDSTPCNALRLDVSDLVEDWDGYRCLINFPVGLVYNEEGLDNPPLQYTFNVWNIWDEYEVRAEAGVITITYPGADWCTWAMNDDDPITLLDITTKETIDLPYTWGWTDKGQVNMLNESEHGFVIDLTRDLTLADGNYILTVPQGFAYVNVDVGGAIPDFTNVLNAEITYEFGWKDGDFTGFNKVEMTEAAEGNGAVYDLSGRMVNAKGNIEGLEKGIYILNGKKVLKK